MHRAVVLDREDIDRALTRIAHEIIERLRGLDGVCLVGIKSGGTWIAQAIAGRLESFAGVAVPVTSVRIGGYRDDRERRPDGSGVEEVGALRPRVVLVDDVIQSGRTARAAMEALLSTERAERIQLAVLVDRGHRELPISPDYVGKNLPSALSEYVSVSPDEVVIHGA
jgi:pyrimidine operon attenuation protein/uracil phosphoribosyltransferase